MFEGLIPNLGTVEPAYPKDLGLESGLGLDDSQVIGLLLGFLLRTLSLCPGELRLFLGSQSLIFSPLSNILGPLGLNQFLL